DCDWLYDELRASTGTPAYRPLPVSLIRRKLNDFFCTEIIKNIIEDDGVMNGLAVETLAAGGRRMRPLLTLLSYLAWQPDAGDDMLIRLSFIIESFHKASLIHDDIQDNSPERYNRPSLHISEGTGVAINVGDYLIGKGYSLLSGLPLPPGRIAKCLQAVSSSHVKMTLGQAQDITIDPLDPAFLPGPVCRINGLKTGEAVKVALLLGAIAAGAPQNDLKLLDEFADAFGMAYQIRDDLNEFDEAADHEHIRDYPILLSLIHEKGLSHLLQTNGHSLTEMVRKIVEDYQLTEPARELLRKKVANCYACLAKLDNFKLRLSLYGVMGKIF
ncbi:MAG: polyprenyl synthetase family protein, partial [Bacteroidota bacterium]